jgi:hypothetical protein
MANQSSVADLGTQPAKEERGRSSVEFTYNGLDDAEDLVTAVRAVGGTGCSLEALAAKLNQAVGGGGFRVKVYSARTFGLLEINRGAVELTDLGLRIVDPLHIKSARVEAFLSVPLYRTMYEQLKGQALPPMAAIERMMLSAGVAPKQKERARQVFIRSAKVAGFFEIQADRLVKPELRDVSQAAAPAPEQPKVEVERRVAPPRYGGGGWDGDGIHPAILGLLRELPAPGAPISAKRKEQLKAAFAMSIDFIYPDPEDAP